MRRLLAAWRRGRGGCARGLVGGAAGRGPAARGDSFCNENYVGCGFLLLEPRALPSEASSRSAPTLGIGGRSPVTLKEN